jgi:hypothetical protein
MGRLAIVIGILEVPALNFAALASVYALISTVAICEELGSAVYDLRFYGGIS